MQSGTHSAEAIRSYLVSLGFATDAASNKAMLRALESVERGSLSLTGTLAKLTSIAGTTAITLGLFATSYAYAMRKTYFASRLAGTSVQHLEAFQVAGKMVGLSENSITSSLKNMNMALLAFSNNDVIKSQDNPLAQFFEGLTGKHNYKFTDSVTTMLDLIKGVYNLKIPNQAKWDILSTFGIDRDFAVQAHLNMQKLGNKYSAALKEEAKYHYDPHIKASMELADKMDMLRFDTHLLAGDMEGEIAPLLSALIDQISKLIDAIYSSIPKTSEHYKEAVAYLHNNPIQTAIASWLDTAPTTTDEAVKQAQFTLSHLGGVTTTVGAVPTRTNNPGDIAYGDFTKRFGGTKTPGRAEATFPDSVRGFDALLSLIQMKYNYGATTIDALARSWIPYDPKYDKSKEAWEKGRLANYERSLKSALGLDVHADLGLDFDPSMALSIAAAIASAEGFQYNAKPGIESPVKALMDAWKLLLTQDPANIEATHDNVFYHSSKDPRAHGMINHINITVNGTEVKQDSKALAHDIGEKVASAIVRLNYGRLI